MTEEVFDKPAVNKGLPQDMKNTAEVNRVARTVGTRYPEWKRKLLESVQAKRGDDHLSDTVAHALDQVIEQHFPDAVKGHS